MPPQNQLWGNMTPSVKVEVGKYIKRIAAPTEDLSSHGHGEQKVPKITKMTQYIFFSQTAISLLIISSHNCNFVKFPSAV